MATTSMIDITICKLVVKLIRDNKEIDLSFNEYGMCQDKLCLFKKE